MAEGTTLEKMEKMIAAGGDARRQVAAADEAISALSAGTDANIDGLRVRLLEDGQVHLWGRGSCAGEEIGSRQVGFLMSVRQFLGLMGWGHTHVGPNGKTPE